MDNNGCWDTSKLTVDVLAHPIAQLDIDTSKLCLRGNEFSNRGNSSTSVSGSTLSRYNWIFDFGASTSSATPATISGVGSHKVKYNSAGIKTTRLTVKDTNGCWDTITKKVEVLAHPVAKLTVNKDTQCLRGNEFTIKENGSVSVSGSKIVRYNWIFDLNAVGGNSANPQFANGKDSFKVKYNGSGYKIVRLTIKDTNSCWDTAISKIKVLAHPVAKLKILDDSLCLRGNEYQFSDSNSIAITKMKSYSWTFGRNASISSASGSGVHKIKYNDTGRSVVYLIIIDDNGCSDTTLKYVFTKQHPKAILTQQSDSMCLRQNLFYFKDSSTAIKSSKISRVNWLFDYGVTSSSSSPVAAVGIGKHAVKYSSIGAKVIRLTVRDTNGCWDTVFTKVKVLAHPTANYSASSFSGCAGKDQFTFKNKSTIGSQKVNKVWWDLGDGVKLTDSSITKIFKESKNYYIKLSAKADNGCDDTVSFTIVLDTIPDVKFSNISGDTQCLNENEFSFADSSIARKAQVLSKIKWEFGDGVMDSINSPFVKHQYKAAGYYQVRLTRWTKNGCSSNITTKIKVNESPKAQVLITKNLVCPKDNNAEIVAVASGGIQPYNWKWNGDPKLTSVKLNNVIAGYYYVEVFDKNNCFGKADIYLKQPDSIKFNLQSTNVTCFDGSDGTAKASVLSGGESPFKFQWNINRPVYFDTLSNLKSGNYVVTITDNRGCVQKGQVFIAQPNKMTFGIDTVKQISCFGQKDAVLDIKVGGGTKPYSFSLNQSTYQTSNQYGNLGKGKYFLKIQDSRKCFGYDTFELFGPKSMNLEILADTLVCFRDSNANLKAIVEGGTPDYTYNWRKNGIYIGNEQNLIKQSAGVYNLIIKDRNGCTISGSQIIIEPEKYRPEFAVPKLICYNSDLLFNVKSSKSNTWITPSKTITVGSQYLLVGFNYSDTGRYRLKSYSQLGCLFEDSFILKMNPRPTVFGDTACINTGASLLTKGAYQANWTGPSGKTYNGSNIWISKAQELDSGEYKVTAITSEGCSETLVTTLLVVPNPRLAIISNKKGYICLNDDVQLSALTNMKTEFTWNGPGISVKGDNIVLKNINSKNFGYYWLVGVNEFGCMDSVNKFIDAKENPVADLDLDQFGCDRLDVEPSVLFRDNSIGSTQRWLYKEDTTINEFTQQSQIIKQNPGTFRYKLVVKNQFGCYDSIIKNFTIFPRTRIFLATAFTPNSDKLNNYYKPVGNNSLESYNMKIYNRWGQKIYEWEGNVNSDETIGSWDGTFNGVMQQEGVYVVVVRAVPKCGAHYNKSQTFHMIR
jgi:gliding motility-associated-like protein